MKRILLSVAVVLMVVWCVGDLNGQCSSGRCPTQPQYNIDVRVRQQRPTPAWRYEHPVGHRAAVVRVITTDGNGRSSLGSGTLVKWSGRVVVLTARHVVQDAKAVVVRLFTGKKVRCRVVKVDAVWDCAVLIPEETIRDVTPADIAYGNDAMFNSGDRLESCGYGGPETKLASNSGLFEKYVGTYQDTNYADWMEISGYVRSGDSGGGVFNGNGQLVGVIWGGGGQGDVKTGVVAVQAGRIHMILQAAFPGVEQKSYCQTQRPSPPMMGPMVPVRPPYMSQDPAPIPVDDASMLPWRNKMDEKVAGIDRKLDSLIIAQQQPPMAMPTPPQVEKEAEKPKEDNTKTLPGRIADKQSEWLAEHGGPISSRLAARADENLDDESAAVRFKGFTQAKVAVLIFCLGVLLVGGLIVYMIHRLNNRLLPKLKEAAEKTANPYDDKFVALLEKIHGRVDTVEEKVKGQLPDLSALRAKADAALHVATQAAVAVVPGAAPAVAAADAVKTAVNAVQSPVV